MKQALRLGVRAAVAEEAWLLYTSAADRTAWACCSPFQLDLV